METKALIGLIDACVTDFESDGLADLVRQLSRRLPALLQDPDDETFDLLTRAARLIAFSKKPEPVADCIHILLDIAAIHRPRGLSYESFGLVERALDLAEDHDYKPELRRACSIYALISTDAGFPARGIEYAVRAAKIARELNDRPSIAAAYCNATNALHAMGLYRECVSVALRTIEQFKQDPSCAHFIAVAQANLANAALSMQHYALGASSAQQACEKLGLPHDANDVLNRVAIEGIWMKNAIGLDDAATVRARLDVIHRLADTFHSPRIRLNRELADAAYEIYSGDPAAAIDRLLKLLKQTRMLPTLYHDNLHLLIRAHEKNHDHAGALLYLGQLVEHLSQSKLATISRLLTDLADRGHAYRPGKDDARSLIRSIQNAGYTPRKKPLASESEYRKVLERLAITAEFREETQGQHTYRVGRLAGLLAAEIGYDAEESQAVEFAARLHDIGKLAIPESLATKPGRFNESERQAMQRHAQIGANILKQCPHPAFRLAEAVARSHHEKWDGTGYPQQLSGEDIPEAARITAIADVYDSLVHDRPYKRAWTHEESVETIQNLAGSHFDPRLCAAFITMIERLRAEHGDALDDYLSSAGEASDFIRAHHEIQTLMITPDPDQVNPFAAVR